MLISCWFAVLVFIKNAALHNSYPAGMRKLVLGFGGDSNINANGSCSPSEFTITGAGGALPTLGTNTVCKVNSVAGVTLTLSSDAVVSVGEQGGMHCAWHHRLKIGYARGRGRDYNVNFKRKAGCLTIS